METRTRHLRDSFLESSEAFISEITNFLQDTKRVKQLIINAYRNDPSLIKNALQKQSKGINLTAPIREVLYEIVSVNMPTILNQFEPSLKIIADLFTKELPKIVASAIKKGHVKALREPNANEVRNEKYHKLRWMLYVFAGDDLILGDCGVIFEVDSPRVYKTFWENSDKLKRVFLPISGKHLVIGSQIIENPSLELKVINRAISECSREFFISKNKTDDLKNLQSSIGDNDYLLTNQEVN